MTLLGRFGVEPGDDIVVDEQGRLLGTDGLPVRDMPAVDQPVQGTIGYHVRSGGHDLTDADWRQYLAFADRHLRSR